MNVIQYDVEETKGKVKDMVTHMTGPGGCISIVTHEQYRVVERNMISGVIAPNATSSYQRTRYHDSGRTAEPNGNSNSLNTKVSVINKGCKTKSVCTSTGDLGLKTFKSLALRNRGRTLKTQAIQTEKPSAPDQKDTSSSFKNKKKKKKKNGGCKRAKRKKGTKLKGDEDKSVRLQKDSCQDESMAENDSAAGISDDSQSDRQNDETTEPLSASKSICDLLQSQTNPD